MRFPILLWSLVLLAGCGNRAADSGPASNRAAPNPVPAVRRPPPALRPVPRRPVDPDPTATTLPASARLPADAERRLESKGLLSFPSRWSGKVHVEQKGSVRYLYVGRRDVIQTRMDMRRPAELLSPYLRCMLVSLGFFARGSAEVRRVAMIGLGGGALTRFFHARWPRMVFHSVDIDPVVVAVARGFFGVKDTATYRSYALDGRRFLAEAKRPYDLIVLDAFDASANVPKQLVSVEFFRLIRSRLSKRGVLAINFLVHSRKVYSALYRTVRSVFPAVARLPLQRLDTHNALLVAPVSAAARPTRAALVTRMKGLQKRLGVSFSLERCARTLDTDRLVAPKGPVLRDPPKTP